MILVPKITLEQNKKQEAILRKEAFDFVSSPPRTELHISDLITPRHAYWKRIKPVAPHRRDYMAWFIGRLLHAWVRSGCKSLTESDEKSIFHPTLKLWYSPDHITEEGIPAEIKTTRSLFLPKKPKDIADYLRQLLMYQVSMGSLRGQLWILYLNVKETLQIISNQGRVTTKKRTSPDYRVFNIKTTKRGLSLVRDSMERERDLLLTALESRNSKILEPCAYWICNSAVCHWWKSCCTDRKQWYAQHKLNKSTGAWLSKVEITETRRKQRR